MKAYTDIEQSKKLAEILPKESADQTWERIAIAGANLDVPEEMEYWHSEIPYILNSKIGIPCWSLAALLDILKNRAFSIDEDANVSLFSYRTVEWWDLTICNSVIEPVTKSDPIDACVEMILKLKEKDLI